VLAGAPACRLHTLKLLGLVAALLSWCSGWFCCCGVQHHTADCRDPVTGANPLHKVDTHTNRNAVQFAACPCAAVVPAAPPAKLLVCDTRCAAVDAFCSICCCSSSSTVLALPLP
jgi:hypothetical protein